VILAVAAYRGYVPDTYEDDAEGTLVMTVTTRALPS